MSYPTISRRPGARALPTLNRPMLALVIAAVVSGCSTAGKDPRIVQPYHDSADAGIQAAEQVFNDQVEAGAPVARSQVERISGFYADTRPRERAAGD